MIPVDSAYRTLTTACAPFRAGSRFGALPDVRFDVVAGQIGLPGQLLPGADDLTAASYTERLHAALDGDGYLVTVRHPLFLDFTVWAQVRAGLTELWKQWGFPIQPVLTELAIGNCFTLRTQPVPRRATALWVLSGSVRVDGTVIKAGDMWQSPPGAMHTQEEYENGLVLRVHAPMDADLPGDELKGMLADLLDRTSGPNPPMPHSPWPPPVRSDGSTAPLPDLESSGQRVRELLAGPELRRHRKMAWLRRVSAGGLEPVPAPANRLSCPPRTLSRSSIRSTGWTTTTNGYGQATGTSFRCVGHSATGSSISYSRVRARLPTCAGPIPACSVYCACCIR